MTEPHKSFIKPAVVAPGEEVTTVGQVFDAPFVVKGRTWLPLIQVLAWGALAYAAGQRKPSRTWMQRLVVGALTMPVVLGSEWLHNLAHAAAARLVGHPVDAIRITWGMPLLVYFEINDESLSPGEHIVRAVGGPLFNLLALPLWGLVRWLSPPDSLGQEVGEAGVWMNAFLLAAGLLPIPGLDGGPILKWSLVARGRSVAEADEVVRQINGPLALGMGALGVSAFRKKKWLIGVLAAMFSVISALIFTGRLKETR